MTYVYYPNETTAVPAEVYLVKIMLPNRVITNVMRVTKAAPAGVDVLIGMDLIAWGDFAVTSKDNKTILSFRAGSQQRIDFTQIGQLIPVNKFPRNHLCPCGSGKKYKQCHDR